MTGFIITAVQGKSNHRRQRRIIAEGREPCDNCGSDWKMDGSKEVLERELLAKVESRRPLVRVQAIGREASQRRFYRLVYRRGSEVAMVYPRASSEEIARIVRLAALYRQHDLPVPRIHEVIDQRLVIEEDVGGLLLQRGFRLVLPEQKERLLRQAARILCGLRRLPAQATASRLDLTRQRGELNFFLEHFVNGLAPVRMERGKKKELAEALGRLPLRLPEPAVFAHRDFHSRNLLLQRGRLVLVDFQDSLVAPSLYDLASFAFDSYLDLGPWRGLLLQQLEKAGWLGSEEELRLTALQRNIKALGTFAFQVRVRGHRAYGRYIPRTLRHILGHLQRLPGPDWEPLRRYFSAVAVDFRAV